MTTATLLKQNLLYYWKTNLVVVLGVATAVAVLAGALLIGESVRASLRNLASSRLGNTDVVVTAPNFFRERLANDLTGPGAEACPLIVLTATVTNQNGNQRAGNVALYGVDDRFWRFHDKQFTAPQNRDAYLSDALAQDLQIKAGDGLLLRVEKPSDIPLESLHGRKDDPGRTIRTSYSQSLSAANLGEFALRPQQGAQRAVFVSLQFLQKEMAESAAVNTILVSDSKKQQTTEQLTQFVQTSLRQHANLADEGILLRPLAEQRSLSVETGSKVISDRLHEIINGAAKSLSLQTAPVLSYLANRIYSGERSVPYSLVTAIDDEQFKSLVGSTTKPEDRPIVLNDWTAKDLGAKPGDTISLDYYLWNENGTLDTRTAQFKLVAITPIKGLAADRDLVPSYPGITESASLSDWDPPFPIDLSQVRRQDEDYWHEYKTTPKAFIPLKLGQELWRTRFGSLTSLRIQIPEGRSETEVAAVFPNRLQSELPLDVAGFQTIPVRAQGMESSKGATDFGEYFLYFSFFLVVSALMLAALFFKLGVEHRMRELGTLYALGFSASTIRSLFIVEGALLSVLGSIIGVAGAIGYTALLLYGLRTFWIDAVGTTYLTLHLAWQPLLIGAAGGVIAAAICIALTLRRLGFQSPRALLAGSADVDFRQKIGRNIFTPTRLAVAAIVLASVLLGSAFLHLISQVPGFFGAGFLFLVASILLISAWLRKPRHRMISNEGFGGLSLLGFRNATSHPGRTTLCIALIAAAAFIIVSVDAFRRSGVDAKDRKSGTGGFSLIAESLLPIVHDPNSDFGREALNLNTSGDLNGVKFAPFRVKPGDDASCLNLYQTSNPRILGVPANFVSEDRFSFQSSLAQQAAEKTNPWLLLDQSFPDGAIPVIGDANSLTYVLHLKLGDDLVIDNGGSPVHLRVVAALSDSVFQSELLISEKNFLKLFPAISGYRYFLIEEPANSSATKTSAALETQLSDFGFDVESAAGRLAEFHRVENTYLSTFQMLGGLGLVLGTLGMAAVLLRNVFERRKELALLRAVGYNSSNFAVMVITESALILFGGLIAGGLCALLSIAPVLVERGGRLPNLSLGFLLLAIFISGAFVSLIATLAAIRSPLIPALHAE
ncbi:MAG TPA: FtsX-like permease family protein [Pyrinomonadaceae bacterium]|nr:FtsX-like permease family protein [Pyrinomonadaceae bacterium]